ncbi:hypothetical protein ACN9MJ_23160 [Acidovorax facilis]|uniref:hypothetical protein n=1 Tax=Acidovorax facilis TaxID=12917 RepID=UPI003CF438DE
MNTFSASSAQVSIALTRQIIQRLQTGTAAHTAAQERPVAMGLLPVSSGVDLQGFGQSLARQLGTIGRVRVVDSATVDAELHEPGIAQREGADATANRRIAMLLDEIEARNDFVLLLADPEPTPWTRRVSRHCDELLLLADAQAEPAIHPIEENCLLRRAPLAEAAEILVLLHPEGTQCPRGTQQWLDRRPVADHVHVRPTLDRDMARLARIQSRTAVGLVLAGGGARGFAHLGIYRAQRTCLWSRRGPRWSAIGMSGCSVCLHGLMPMQAHGASNRPISLQPFGQWSLRAVCGVAALANSRAIACALRLASLPAKTAARPLGDHKHVLGEKAWRSTAWVAPASDRSWPRMSHPTSRWRR